MRYTYYIQHNQTEQVFNAETGYYQESLTVICLFTDRDEAQRQADINDLTDYTIKIWE